MFVFTSELHAAKDSLSIGLSSC